MANLKSTTIEKGLDLAKSFIGKILGPASEEIGLLVSDNIRYFRFKNQVRILIKANNYVESKGLKVKHIPTKILVPLLENASLEDDEELQDEWARLIGNMADSEQNLQNQIFPYLLSQTSKEELAELRILQSKEREYLELNSEYKSLISNKNNKSRSKEELKLIEESIREIEQSGYRISLKYYEQSNLERLGLIKQLPPKIMIRGYENYDLDDIDTETSRFETWRKFEVQYDVYDFRYRITELGEAFLLIISKKELVTNAKNP